MTKTEKYLHHKSMMMEHLAFAFSNQSMEDSLYQLIFYHWYKDKFEEQYFLMSYEERKVLHTLLIL